MQTLKELVSRIKLVSQFDVAMYEKIDELEHRVYCLEEDSKRMKASYEAIRKQYSEVLLYLADLRKKQS